MSTQFHLRGVNSVRIGNIWRILLGNIAWFRSYKNCFIWQLWNSSFLRNCLDWQLGKCSQTLKFLFGNTAMFGSSEMSDRIGKASRFFFFLATLICLTAVKTLLIFEKFCKCSSTKQLNCLTAVKKLVNISREFINLATLHQFCQYLCNFDLFFVICNTFLIDNIKDSVRFLKFSWIQQFGCTALFDNHKKY